MLGSGIVIGVAAPDGALFAAAGAGIFDPPDVAGAMP
jgi:hypothetical protein